jgi:hypothetical protein
MCHRANHHVLSPKSSQLVKLRLVETFGPSINRLTLSIYLVFRVLDIFASIDLLSHLQWSIPSDHLPLLQASNYSALSPCIFIEVGFWYWLDVSDLSFFSCGLLLTLNSRLASCLIHCMSLPYSLRLHCYPYSCHYRL